MTRLHGPMFSVVAEGTFGEVITYQRAFNKPVSKANRFPTYRRSPEQAQVRNTLAWAVSMWHALHGEKKAKWNQEIDYKGLRGYQYFIRTFLKQTYAEEYQFELPPRHGFCITGNHITGEFFTGGAFLEPPA